MAEEEKESVSFIRRRNDLGNYRIDLPSGRVEIHGLEVYRTNDPTVIEVLSGDPELARCYPETVEPAKAKPNRK